MVHIGCRHEHGDCGHGHGQSTKGILNEVEQAALMTPLWNDLRQTYENGKVVTLEVPLRVGGTPLKAWSPRKADGHAGSVDGSTVTMKLILQKTSKPEINAILSLPLFRIRPATTNGKT